MRYSANETYAVSARISQRIFPREKSRSSRDFPHSQNIFLSLSAAAKYFFTGAVLFPTADASPAGVETVFSSAFALPRLTDNARPALAQRIHHALQLHCLHS